MQRKILLILLFIPFWGYSTHLLGGSMDLKSLGANSYQLTVHVIADCYSGVSATFDNNIVVGLFEKGTDSLINSIFITLNKFEIDTFKIPDNCYKKYRICNYVGTYSKILDLDSTIYNNPDGYYLSWQRCCRPGTIINMINSGNAGLCLYLEIPNLSLIKNNSPIYKNRPSLLLNNGFDFTYNFNFFDEDSDSLRYSLITPLNGFLDQVNPVSTKPVAGPYPKVGLPVGFSENNLLGGIKTLKIDSLTGELSGMPNRTGSFIIGVRVEEIRQGKKIGEVRLEVEINVVSSNKANPEIILVSSDSKQITSDTIHISTPVSFFFNAFATTNSDSVFLQIKLEDSLLNSFSNKPIIQSFTSGYLKTMSGFAWHTYCGMVDSLKYIPVTILAYDNDCPVAKSISKTIWLEISNLPQIKGPNEVCVGAQGIEFSLPDYLSANTYTWKLPNMMNGSSNNNKIVVNFKQDNFSDSLSVTGNNGCGSDITLYHRVSSAPKPPTPELSLWGNTLYSSIDLGNQWFRNDSLLIGSTKHFHELKTNGSYYAVINWYGCKSDPSEPYVVTFMGLPNHIKKPIPQVFPNPFSQYIEVLYPFRDQEIDYVIFNSLGQAISSGKLSNNISRISTDNYPPGIYLMQINSNDSGYNLKLIKE